MPTALRALATGSAICLGGLALPLLNLYAAQEAPGTLNVSEDARPLLTAPRTGEPVVPPVPLSGRTTSTLQFVGGNGQPDASATSGNGVVLKWRGRRVDDTPQLTTADGAAATSGVWLDRRVRGGVRTAALDDRPNPFQDPFGDRLVQQKPAAKGPAPDFKLRDAAPRSAPPAPELAAPGEPAGPSATLDAPATMPAAPELQPVEGAPAVNPLPLDLLTAPAAPATKTPAGEKPTKPDPTAPSLSPAAPEQPAAPAEPAPTVPPLRIPETKSALPSQPSVELEDAAPVMPRERVPAPSEAAPAPPAETPQTRPRNLLGPPTIPPPSRDRIRSSDRQKCDRIYNDRDCCEETSKCAAVREQVRNYSIKQISLDITANFKPDAETDQQRQEAQLDRLKQMPARVWKDRQGRVVADGRVTAVRNRRAVITTQDGREQVVPFGTLCDDDLCCLTAWWGVPSECTLGDGQYAGRSWEQVTLTWKAAALCHKPSYFEQVQLERYGHTVGPVLEAPLAGAHFFGSVLLLPYQMGIHPPQECQYALGYYRPGSCAPWLLPPFPVSLRGGLIEAGAIVGGVFLIP